MPSGKTARPNITDNKDGTITVRYAPTEKGLHQMGIKYDGNHIPGEWGAGLGRAGLSRADLRAARAALFLPAFFQQTAVECPLCADTLQSPGESDSLVGADLPQSGPYSRSVGLSREAAGGCW